MFRANASEPLSNVHPHPIIARSWAVTDALIAQSDPQPHESVMVVGPYAIEALVKLVRHGCAAATAFGHDALRASGETADIVWIVGIDNVAAQVGGALHHLGHPRLVAFEFAKPRPGIGAEEELRPFLGKLALHGLTRISMTLAAGRVIAVASRPAPLRHVA